MFYDHFSARSLLAKLGQIKGYYSCRCCTQSASYQCKKQSATNGAQLVPISTTTNNFLMHRTTKFYIYVINLKFNHSNNISLTINICIYIPTNILYIYNNYILGNMVTLTAYFEFVCYTL